MANNPNADALLQLLDKLCPDGIASWHLDYLADKLAANGVLVISDAVLTDEAMDRTGLLEYSSEWGGIRTTVDEAARVRAALARIAKGDTQ